MTTGALLMSIALVASSSPQHGSHEVAAFARFLSRQSNLPSEGRLEAKIFRAITPRVAGQAGIREDGPSPEWTSYGANYAWTPLGVAEPIAVEAILRRDANHTLLLIVVSNFAHLQGLKFVDGTPWRYPELRDAVPAIEEFASEMFKVVPGTRMVVYSRTREDHWQTTFRASSEWQGYPDPAGADIQIDRRTGLISKVTFEGAFPNVEGIATGELLPEAEIKARADAEMLRRFYGPLAQTTVGKALVTIKNPVSGRVEYWPINQFLYEELTEDGSAIKPRGQKWCGSVNAFSGEVQVSLMVGEAGGGNQRPLDLLGFELDFEQGFLMVQGKKFPPVNVDAPSPREFRFSEIGWYVQGNVLLPLQIDTDRRLAMVSFMDEKHYFRY